MQNNRKIADWRPLPDLAPPPPRGQRRSPSDGRSVTPGRRGLSREGRGVVRGRRGRSAEGGRRRHTPDLVEVEPCTRLGID